jgi:hypothetical protein
VVEEMDLAHLDEITRQLHFKIEAILTQESSTKVKGYVGRLNREFAPHLPFYLTQRSVLGIKKNIPNTVSVLGILFHEKRY